MTNYEKLINTLKEVFMLDKAELDFGIYRIMNQKRKDIEKFLEKDLVPQVQQVLADSLSIDKQALQKELDDAIKSAQALGADPNTLPKVQQLKARLGEAADMVGIENEVFSLLANFFKRYFDNGDFISMRRYKQDVYSIPYEGEEVKLHWANADQYYIKTSEYFKNYRFKLKNEKTVVFELVEVSTEQNNNKTQGDKERKFVIYAENPCEIINDEFKIYFTYEPADKKVKQSDLLDAAFEAVKDQITEEFDELRSPRPTEKDKKRTLLQKHLLDYTARNTFDYFIHKDLGGFLTRELDFYIKNEVLFIDDLNTRDEQEFLKQLSKIKAIKKIGEKIIAFLAQLENFQKKLWLKKKMVVECNYCITLDRVPTELYSEIAQNQAQIAEWVKLFAIDQISESPKKDLYAEATVGYSNPLSLEFLNQNKFLVLDTAFFTESFKWQIISSIENFDEQCDGLLINSENFQALSLLSDSKKGNFVNVYIDPPYNTNDDGFLYKDNYSSSSWLSLMKDRIELGMSLLSENGVCFISIGDEEQEHLGTLLRSLYGKERFFATLIWEKKKKGTFLSGTIAKMKDYILCISKDASSFKGLIGEINSETETYPCVNADNPRDIRTIMPGIKSKFREINYTLSKGAKISAGNMDLVLHSDLVIENGVLVSELVIEGNWRYSQSSMKEYAEKHELYITQDLYLRRIVNTPRYKRMKDLLQRMGENGESDFRAFDINDLDKFGWGTNEDANDELHQILGEQYAASYPKPSKLLTLLLSSSRHGSGCYLDYFAGSGTTGHAVINLNRLDGSKRKYFLVEMGNYFDTVTKPRIQKVIYSKDWKDGKPVSREGISNCFKYMRLESYEDTLNNLVVLQTAGQQAVLETNPTFREGYTLNYMLDVETKDSLLNLKWFENPFECFLNITRNNELQATKIDLVETFNYLIGLVVESYATPKAGYVIITGQNLAGERILVIWRDCTQHNSTALNEFLAKSRYNPLDREFDRIYVNGDNNVENLKLGDERWKVVLIEEEFHKRMFELN